MCFRQVTSSIVKRYCPGEIDHRLLHQCGHVHISQSISIVDRSRLVHITQWSSDLDILHCPCPTHNIKSTLVWAALIGRILHIAQPTSVQTTRICQGLCTLLKRHWTRTAHHPWLANYNNLTSSISYRHLLWHAHHSVDVECVHPTSPLSFTK